MPVRQCFVLLPDGGELLIRRYWKPVIIGLLASGLGVLTADVGKHLWQDHLALHELALIEVRRQQGQK